MSAIFERFTEIAERFPDLVALQMKEEAGPKKLIYRELFRKAIAISSNLSSLGIKGGDSIAIFSENCPEWCAAYLGIVSIGAVAVPLDFQYTKEEVANLLKDSGSKAIFTSKTLFTVVQEATRGLEVKIIRLDELAPEKPHLSLLAKDGKEVIADDPASLLYTSGTTGTPKGVMLSHRNLISNADAIISTGIINHEDHVLGILPLHHTYPFMTCFLAPLLVGGKVTFLNSLKGPDIVKTIRDDGVSVLVGVPQLYSMMRKAIKSKIESLTGVRRLIAMAMFNVSRTTRKRAGINIGKIIFRKVHREFGRRLRFFASGGACLDPAIKTDMEGFGFTLLEGYGLTETSPVVTFNLPGKDKTGSVGTAINHVEVRIEKPDSSGVGEVIVKGPNVMKGYFKRLDMTAGVIKDGWFHTGDLGYKDQEGYLFITGRSKEVIVLSSGKNIYPEDVEAHYLQSPYIKEICVIGIPDPSLPGSFEGIKSLVFPNYETLAADRIVNVGDWIKWQIEKLSATLPAYKRVSGFSILKEPLPRTHLGKIRRFMVKETGLEVVSEERPVSDEDQMIMETDSAKMVLRALSSLTDKKISINSNLELDLGIDSLGRIELMVSLENETGMIFPQTFSSDVATVRDVILKISEYERGKSTIVGLKKPISWSEIVGLPPSEELIRRINIQQGFAGRLTLSISLWVLSLVFRFFLRLEVVGMENVPKEGACILTPNHVSFIDGFVVGAAIRKRLPGLYAVGFRGLFHGPLTSRLAKWSHIISIDADQGLSESLQASSYVLKEGVALIVFPEGGRSVDGRILPFKKGVGILAGELNVPLVPTYIDGALDVLPRGAWIPRLKKVTVRFGRPLTIEEIRGLDYQGIADRLREEVISLRT